MSMMEVETKEVRTHLENLNAVRNHVALRYAENQCSQIYWERMARLAKNNSQEKVDANKNFEAQVDAVRKDKLYLECIDELIKKEKSANPTL
jgi:hypothetical protein